MAKWIEYTGSDKQISDIQTSEHGWMTEDFITIDGSAPIHDLISVGEKYLICQPHPYADLIKIWADTGCPVWVRPRKPYEFKISDYLNHPTTRLMVDGEGVYLITTTPDWNILGAEYSLTPFND